MQLKCWIDNSGISHSTHTHTTLPCPVLVSMSEVPLHHIVLTYVLVVSLKLRIQRENRLMKLLAKPCNIHDKIYVLSHPRFQSSSRPFRRRARMVPPLLWLYTSCTDIAFRIARQSANASSGAHARLSHLYAVVSYCSMWLRYNRKCFLRNHPSSKFSENMTCYVM